MKAITTRSGVAYEGPSIHTNPSPIKVVERETEETTDKEQTNFQGSTSHIQPPVNPILILEPDVPKTLPNPNISYPSRLNDQKFHEKSLSQMEKIFQIFQDLRFDISFANALLLMPRFSPTIKNLLMNKEKFDINPLFNEILEDVESKDSNISNFDEPVYLTHLFFDEMSVLTQDGKIDKIDGLYSDK
ncbi:hypothetical protein Tco_0578047 [Tanacetum coccineum]